MAIFKSSNPALSTKFFKKEYAYNETNNGIMSVRGTINKFGFLLLMLVISASFNWNLFNQNKGNTVTTLTLVGLIIAFILVLLMVYNPKIALYIAPAYSIAEGFFVGGFSVIMNEVFKNKYPNLILHSVGLTFGVAFAMFLLYNFRIIKVTEKFRSIIFTATLGIAIYYGLIFILRLFGVDMSFAFDSSLLSIGISLFIVCIAAFSLLLDFDFIEQSCQKNAPKYMEWFAAIGLLITLVWLYLEIVRLLSKINSRD